MSSVGNEILTKVSSVVGDSLDVLSRTILHSLFPKEFEMYMLTFELTDFNGRTMDLFTFPINPSSMSKSEPFTKTINRSHGSIVVNRAGYFTPQDLTIRGNFGKSFKILIRNTSINFFSLRLENELSHTIKSGYGSFKVLQDICNRSNELNSNNEPNLLFLHNFILGESYLVEVLEFSSDLTTSANMLYNYNLRLKLLSPVQMTTVNRTSTLTPSLIQRTLYQTVKSIKEVIL